MDGYLYITHLPLFPKMYIFEYTFSQLFDETSIVRSCFNLDYVKRIKNVDYVYTNLMNSQHLVTNKLNIDINGMKYDLYQLSVTIQELDNLFYSNQYVDIYWNKNLIKYRFPSNQYEYNTNNRLDINIDIEKKLENMNIF